MHPAKKLNAPTVIPTAPPVDRVEALWDRNIVIVGEGAVIAGAEDGLVVDVAEMMYPLI